jgi:hypothetical protein
VFGPGPRDKAEIKSFQDLVDRTIDARIKAGEAATPREKKARRKRSAPA